MNNTRKIIPTYGIVEGFYGQPWSFADRYNMIDFISNIGTNSYIYAPKHDPYHREFWKQEYPSKELDELKKLVNYANEKNVELIFAISPGMDLHYNDIDYASDVRQLLDKLQSMYDIGFKQFAVFFDDIEVSHGEKQAEVLNIVNRDFVHCHDDIKPLITVPTEYFTKNMFERGKIKPYSLTFSSRLDQDIVVLFTGREVCPDGLSCDDVDQFRYVYRNRPIGIWWNYPVNDYIPNKPALGPLDQMEACEHIDYFFINPMDKVEMSKIAIYTGAAYAKKPEAYNEDIEWENAINKLFGNLAPEMKLFASEHQRLEGRSAHIGRQDAPELYSQYDAFFASAVSGNKIESVICAKKLIELLQKYNTAYHVLQTGLTEKILEEISFNLELQIENKSLDILLLSRFVNNEISGIEARDRIIENRKKVEENYINKVLFPLDD